MMLKRMLAILMVLAMLLSVMPVGVFAAEESTADGTTAESTETTPGETEASSETEAPAAESAFTLELAPEKHTTTAGQLGLNLYLSAVEDKVVGSYQFTVNVAEGLTFNGYQGTGALGENNVVAYVAESQEATIAVGTEPVLLGVISVSGDYTAGTSVTLADITLSYVEVNEWNADTAEAGTANVVYTEPTSYHAHDASNAWTGVDTLPAEAESGCYYLTGDISMAEQMQIREGDNVTLCLNGYTISADNTAEGTVTDRAFRVSGSGQLTICDCTAHTDENGEYVAGQITGGTNAAILVPNVTDKNEDGSEIVNTVVVNLYDGIITGNSEVDGGAILVQDGATFNMYGGEISGNSATGYAGAVYAGDATVNLYGGEISGNSADKRGGAIYATAGAVINIIDGQISGNESPADGGAIYTLNSTLNIEGGEISNNTAKRGGAIFANTTSTVTMSGGKISNNSADDGDDTTATGIGGAMVLDGADMTATGGVISNNTAEGNGGAIYNSNGAKTSMNGVTLNANTGANGGGIYTTGSSTELTLSDVTMLSNVNTGAGASAVAIYGGSICTIDGGLYQNNETTVKTTHSGAVYVPNRTNTLIIQGAPVIDDNIVVGGERNIFLQRNTDKDADGDGIEDSDTDAQLVIGTLTEGARVSVAHNGDAYTEASAFLLTHYSGDYSNWNPSWVNYSSSPNSTVVYNNDTWQFELVSHAHADDVEGTEWINWGNNTSELTSLPTEDGYYYLTADVSLAAATGLSKGQNIVICLNGHTIKAPTTTNYNRIFRLSGGTNLTVCDCSAHKDADGNLVAGTLIPGNAESGVAGMYDSASTLTLQNLIIDGEGVDRGSSKAGVTCISTNDAVLNIEGCVIRNLSTTGSGSALYVNNRAYVTITDTVFDNITTATGYGGAIYANATNTDGIFNITNSEFRNCSAYAGSAIYTSKGTWNITNTVFTGNTELVADGYPGVIRVMGATMTLTGCEMTDNKSQSTFGTALSVSAAASNVVIDDCIITGNVNTASATTFRGAVYVTSTAGSVTISGATVIDNNYVGNGTKEVNFFFQDTGAQNVHLSNLEEGARIGLTPRLDATDVNTLVNVTAGTVAYGWVNDGRDGANYIYNTETKLLEKAAHVHEDMPDAPWTAWTSTTTVPNTDDAKGYTTTTTDETTGETTTSAPKSGYYYLTQDVTLTTMSYFGEGEIVLCLNGHNIIANYKTEGNASDRIYRLFGNANLTICDCTAHTDSEGNYVAGKLTGGSMGAIFVPNDTGTNDDGSEIVNTVVLNLYDGIITGNTHTSSGGAVALQDGATLNLYGGEITGNTGAGSAGGLYLGAATLNMTGGKIYGNTSNRGGAIYASGGSEVNITGGEITGNTAAYGAAMHISGSTANISGITISDNDATKQCGAINITSSSNVTLTGVTISGNTAVNEIGAINCEGSSTITLDECTITGNTSASLGAVYVYNNNTQLTITGDTVIDDNYSTNANTANYWDGEQNLYLPKDAKAEEGTLGSPAVVNLTALGENAIIGITSAFAESSRVVAKVDADYSSCVSSDHGGRILMYNEDTTELTLYAAGATEQNPITLTETENALVITGTEYYQGYFSGMILTVTGTGDFSVIYNGETTAAVDGVVSMAVSSSNPRMPVIFAITGDGEYSVNFTYPVGNMSNPDTLVIGSNTASIEAGNTQGYYYTWTAEAGGTLTITMPEGNWMYTVNNMTTYAYGDTQWSDSDPVVNPYSIEVAAGDEIQVIVNNYDPADMWNTPAGDLTFTADFVATPGSEANPYWLSAGENALTIPAGATVYYVGRFGGMVMNGQGENVTVEHNGTTYTLTAEGVSFDCVQASMWEPSTFVVTNSSDADAAITLTVTYPVGNAQNPAQLVIGENTASIEAGNTQGYYYTWTAEKAGTLTITMPEGNWTYAVNNMTAGTYGDTQWSDSDPVMQSYSIEVAAGDELQIMVNTYDPEDSWNNPAGELTITASFQELPAIELFSLSGMTMSLGNSLSVNFVINTSKLDGDGHYAVITKAYADGTTKSVTVNQADWAVYSGSLYFFSYNGVAAKEMSDNLNVIVYNSKGQQVTNEYNRTIADYCLTALGNEEAKASPSADKLTLYVDMLNYGAAAQTYFTYNTEAPANAGLSETQKGYATGDVTATSILVKGTGFAGVTLSLESEIILNFVYQNTTIGNAAYAVATYTDHNGKAKSMTYQAEEFAAYNSSLTMVPVSGMSVADCGQAVTVTLYDADGNVLSTSVDSVNSYISRVANPSELFTMILRFGTAAYNYFH